MTCFLNDIEIQTRGLQSGLAVSSGGGEPETALIARSRVLDFITVCAFKHKRLFKHKKE